MTQQMASPEHSADRPAARSAVKIGVVGAAAAFIQGACALLMLVAPLKLALGIGAVTAAGSSSFLHQDAIRLPLRYISAALATASLYVVWNGYRLRKNPAAQWRTKPLSHLERRVNFLVVTFALLSWALIIGEIYAHRIIHPAK